MFNKEQLEGWSANDTVDFFVNHRNTYEDLYKSEKYFLTKELILSMDSILDVGCAAGGFCNICTKL